MSECAACGGHVDGFATYCDACSDDDSGAASSERTQRSETATHDATSPVARSVGILLAAAVALGGFMTFQSLQYVPQVLSFYTPAESVGFLLNQGITVALLVAFALMAKRLFDGTADVDRYGRILQVLAVASLASGVIVTAFPNAITRWFPTLLDPAYVVLNVVVFHTYRAVFAQELGVLLLGVVGASITFAAGTRLRRE